MNRFPVFKIIEIDGADFDIEDPLTYDVELAPLYEEEDEEVDAEFWGKEIGFDGTPADLLEEFVLEEQFQEAFSMDRMLRFEGRAPEPIPIPLSKVARVGSDLRYQVNHGTYIDFRQLPPMFVPKEYLFNYLSIRRRLRQRMSLEEAVRAVETIREQEENDIATAPRPRQYNPSASDHSFNYQSQDVLEMRPTEWVPVTDDEASAILAALRDRETVEEIDFEAMVRIGKTHNGVTKRAVDRVTGGHYDITSLEKATACTQDGGEVTIFRITCTPSYKEDDYSVSIGFNKSDGSYNSDVSVCTCAAGNAEDGCSHVLGSLMVFALIQGTEWDLNAAVEALPPAVKSIQSKLIYCDFAFGRDPNERAVKAACRLARRAQREADTYTLYSSRAEADDSDDESLGEMDMSLPIGSVRMRSMHTARGSLKVLAVQMSRSGLSTTSFSTTSVCIEHTKTISWQKICFPTTCLRRLGQDHDGWSSWAYCLIQKDPMAQRLMMATMATTTTTKESPSFDLAIRMTKRSMVMMGMMIPPPMTITMISMASLMTRCPIYLLDGLVVPPVVDASNLRRMN